MRALSASQLLTIWEHGSGRTPLEQALVILGSVFPQAPGEALARLDIAQRDLSLLHLRQLTFGSQVKGLADCPACSQRLEFDFDLRDLPVATLSLPDPETMELPRHDSSFRMGDYEVTFRLPNSLDLLALRAETDIDARRRQLLQVCILSVRGGDQLLPAADLPSEQLNALVEHMGQNNPLADLSLPAICPACNHGWEIIFDIVSYFWSEIHAWSIRLLREVHSLAWAYGWQEADILAMSAWRRQRYLEMIGA